MGPFFDADTQEECCSSSRTGVVARRRSHFGQERSRCCSSSAGLAPPVVAPVPSVGQAGARAEEAFLGVTEHMAAEVIPPPTSERTEPPLVLVVPSMVGAALQAKASASQAEVGTTVTSQA